MTYMSCCVGPRILVTSFDITIRFGLNIVAYGLGLINMCWQPTPPLSQVNSLLVIPGHVFANHAPYRCAPCSQLYQLVGANKHMGTWAGWERLNLGWHYTGLRLTILERELLDGLTSILEGPLETIKRQQLIVEHFIFNHLLENQPLLK